MVSHKFVAAFLIVLVEFRVAKLDTVEIKLGSRNVKIPLDGHVKVKRFKPEEFENLKMNIPGLVELVAKAKSRLPPTAPPLPTPHHPLPPDTYQAALQYERPYPHLSNEHYPEYQVPNYSKAHLPRNNLHQPPINRHFSEYNHQENNFEKTLPRLYHPLLYYDYTQTPKRSKKIVQGGTEYYPLLRTPNHSQSKSQVTTTGNNFPKIVHITEPHLKIKVKNDDHTHQRDMPRKHLLSSHNTDKRLQYDTKNYAQTQASNDNQDYIASYEVHHEFSPNISTWLHNHEILKHIPSKKPASQSKNPGAAHGPHETLVYRDVPNRYTSSSNILEDTEVPKDKVHILAKKKITSHLTSRLKEDKIIAHPEYTVKKNVATSRPTSLHEENIEVLHSAATAKGNELSALLAGSRKTGVKINTVDSHSALTSKPDEVVPRTTPISIKNLKEVYTTPQSDEATRNLRDVWLSESTTPNPVNQRSQYQYQTQASNNNQEYIASYEVHHEFSPNISTWLHDHEILKHIPSKKSASQRKNPGAAHGPHETLVYRDVPNRYTSSSNILEDTEVPKDKVHILAKKKITSHLTSRLKEDKIIAHPEYTVKKNVATSRPTSLHEENIEVLHSAATAKGNELSALLAGSRKTDVKIKTVDSHSTLTSKPDEVVPSTSPITIKILKEVYSRPQPDDTTRILRDVWASESTTPNPVDQRNQYQISTMNSVSNSQTPQIPQSETNIPIISSIKNDKSTNSQKMLYFMEAGTPLSITPKEFLLRQSKTYTPPVSSSEHETADNTKKKYTDLELDTTDNSIKIVKDKPQVENSTTVILTSSFFEHNSPEILYTLVPQTDIAITSTVHDTTPKVEIFVTAPNVDDDRNTSLQNNNIRIESFVKDLSTATSNPLDIYIDVSTNASAYNITLESHAVNSAKNISITAFPENNVRTQSEETSIDVTTTTSSEHDITSEAQDVAALTTTDASLLNITSESDIEDSRVNFSSSYKKSMRQDSKDLFSHEYGTTTLFQTYTPIRTDELAINTATEFYSQDSVTDVPTTDDIETHFNQTDPKVSLNGSKEISARNTTTNPQERNSETEVDTFIWMTSTEPAESKKQDLESNRQEINHSTFININTPVLSTTAEPYTQDLSIDIPTTSSSEYNTPHNMPHTATDEYALNETRESYLQNSRKNMPPTSFEHDIAPDVEGELTTTALPRASIGGVTMASSIQSTTEASPASPATLASTTALAATPSTLPQHKTAEIDAVAAVKRRPCKHGRKKACGTRGTGGPAATGRRRRRRKHRTTRAPRPPAAAPAPEPAPAPANA